MKMPIIGSHGLGGGKGWGRRGGRGGVCRGVGTVGARFFLCIGVCMCGFVHMCGAGCGGQG